MKCLQSKNFLAFQQNVAKKNILLSHILNIFSQKQEKRLSYGNLKKKTFENEWLWSEWEKFTCNAIPNRLVMPKIKKNPT